MSSSPHVTPEKIMQLFWGFTASKTLLSAVELRVFARLSHGPLSLEQLTAAVGIHQRAARDFFDTLVTLGMLEREGNVYSNTPETEMFLVQGKPSYIGGMLEMANERLYPFWGDLTEGLKTGLPQNEIKRGGPGLFEALYNDPTKLRLFLGAMTGLSMGASIAIAQKFPWKNYKTVLDVGGAQGGLVVQIALHNDHITGGILDLPMVGPVYEEYVASFGLQERLKFRSLDFFKEPLPHADVITMGHILHDWNLEEKKMLLRKAYEALPNGGALIVFEALIDDDRRKNAFGLLMSLNMLIETPGGFDYTGADCSGWMREVGFRETRVEHLVGPDSMVIAIK